MVSPLVTLCLYSTFLFFTDPSPPVIYTLSLHDALPISQNIYKGLAGFFLIFNDQDTGDETTGFHLPSGQFDIPMMLTDKVFDSNGQLFFDLFTLDVILGDKFLVNGNIQPLLHVHPSRFRFLWS